MGQCSPIQLDCKILSVNISHSNLGIIIIVQVLNLTLHVAKYVSRMLIGNYHCVNGTLTSLFYLEKRTYIF